jgi:PKD repeat protein
VTSEAPVPVVIISASPDPSIVGGTTTFDGSQSYSGVDIVSYIWDFGDGAGTAEGATVEYVYQAAGIYNVTLTVQDTNGQTAAGQYPITVQ